MPLLLFTMSVIIFMMNVIVFIYFITVVYINFFPLIDYEFFILWPVAVTVISIALFNLSVFSI